MKVWKKQTIRWTKNGKNVPKGTRDSVKKVIESKRFYGSLKTSSGKTKQQPLTEDEKTSLKLLIKLQNDEDKKRVLGVTQTEDNRSKAVSVFLAEYEKELRSRGNTEYHVTRTITCIRFLLTATAVKTLDDLDSGRISNVLSNWRTKGRPTGKGKRNSFSVERSNVYSRAIKGFTRWLWVNRKSDYDAMASMRLLNASVDRRHKRRALSNDEIQRLLKATRGSKKTYSGKGWTFSPEDREMLYTLAVWTGLRCSELASLSVHSFDLEKKTITVDASYSKRRREDALPLHDSLIGRLQEWLSGKTGKVFPGDWNKSRHQVKMLRRDLKAAGIEYIDDQQRHVDFHALRHTFVTQLARNNVHPSKAQKLARHSSVTLTLGVYSHVETDELRDAVNVLPSF